MPLIFQSSGSFELGIASLLHLLVEVCACSSVVMVEIVGGRGTPLLLQFNVHSLDVVLEVVEVPGG